MFEDNMINQNYDATAFVYFMITVLVIILAIMIAVLNSRLEKLKQHLGRETYGWILGISLKIPEKEYADISEYFFRTKLRILYQIYKVKNLRTSFLQGYPKEF
jgi:hypothetical protein